MATNADLLKQFINAKKSDIQTLDDWGLYLRAKEEAPDMYADFEKLLVIGGVKERSLENEAFRSALRQFAVNFSRALLSREELSAESLTPIQNDLESSLVPREVLDRAREILADKAGFENKYKERFVGRLVDNYVKQLRQEQRLAAITIHEDRLHDAIVQIADTSPDRAAFTREALVVFQREVNTIEAEKITQQYFSNKSTQDELGAYYSRGAIFKEFQRVGVDLSTTRPDIAEEILIEKIVNNPFYPIEEHVKDIARDLHLIDVMAASHIENESLSDGSYTNSTKTAIGTFFRSYTDTGFKKTLAPLADVAVSVFGPKTQFAVADILTGKAFKNVVHDKQFEAHIKAVAPAYLPTLLGLRSQADAHLKTLTEKHGGSRVALFISQFTTGPEQAIKRSIELQAKHAGLLGTLSLKDNFVELAKYKPNQFHPGALHHFGAESSSFLIHFWLQSRDGVMAVIRGGNTFSSHVVYQKIGSVASWILQWGTGRAGGTARAALGRWALGAFAGKTVTALLGFAAGGPIGAIVAGFLGNVVLSKLFGGIKGIFGGLSNVARYGHAGKQRWYEDPSSLGFAMLLVGTPIALVFFMTFMTTSIITGAFSTTSGRPIGGEPAGSSAKIPYSGQDPPASAITTAPSRGTLSQTPFMDAGTHKNVDAIDVVVNAGEPVVAAQDGFIVSNGTESGCLQDENLGNHVRIVGSCGGQQCFTTYAHLLSCSSIVTAAVPGDTKKSLPATLIKAGTNLGQVGSTGNSTGAHLHFQYNGPGKLEDFFPSIGQKKI